MKTDKYSVTFINGDSIIISAFNPRDAFFLAVAERIKQGKNSAVDSIFDFENRKFYVIKKDNLQNLITQR